MLTALDLIAGAGGATQGLKDAGYRVLAAVEEWSGAVRMFSANHPEGSGAGHPLRRAKSVADIAGAVCGQPRSHHRLSSLPELFHAREDGCVRLAKRPDRGIRRAAAEAGDVIDLAGPIEDTDIRDMDTIDQMMDAVAGLVGRRLLYRELVA